MPPLSVDGEDLITEEVILGLWHSVTGSLQSVSHVGSNNYKREAEKIRNTYATYFMNDGAVPWQWKCIGLDAEPNNNELLAQRLEEEDVDDVGDS